MPLPLSSNYGSTIEARRTPEQMRRFSSSQASKGTLYDDDIERGHQMPSRGLPAVHSRHDSDDEFDEGDIASPTIPPPALVSHSGGRGRNKSARIAGVLNVNGQREPRGLRVHWAKFRKRIGTGTAPSTSELDESIHTAGSSMILRRPSHNFDAEKPAAGVDEVVVDRAWFDEIKVRAHTIVRIWRADPLHSPASCRNRRAPSN
jgi:hypothetical protein